jgi:predicted nucleic acid-binding protein
VQWFLRNLPTGCAATRDAKGRLQAWFTRLMAALHGRILSFNVSVAHVWAEQQRELERAGRRMPIEDSYIAATPVGTTSRSSPATTNTFTDPA